LLVLLASQCYASVVKTAALYAQSNNPAGNQIYVYQVDLNSWTPTFVNAVNTNDVGGGTPHSQSSLVTSGKYLLATNGVGNSISLFWIDGMNASNLTFIAKQSIQGTFPTSIAATASWGNLACVVTSFGNLTLSCYQFNQSGLFYNPAWTRNLGIYVNDSSFPTSQISFSPKNSFLVIQFKGLPQAALVFLIRNNALSANPVPIQPKAPLGPKSYGFAFNGDNMVVTTDAQDGILSYTINNDGTVSTTNNGSVNPANTMAFCWMAWDAWLNEFYGIAAGSGNVTEVAVDQNNVLTVKSSPTIGPNAGLTDAVIVPSSGTDWLYVLSKSRGITVWKISGVGALAYVNSVPYPSGQYNSTMAGLAYAVITSNSAPYMTGSFIALAVAILGNLLATL